MDSGHSSSSSSSPFLLLPFFVFWVLLNIPPSFCANGSYTSCSNQFNCGKISVGYPFWGNNRPEGCGYPELKLNCINEIATLEIRNLAYRVLDVNSDSEILRISREDFMDDLCLTNFVDTALDDALFEYINGYENITLVYGCLPSYVPILAKFTCLIDGVLYDGYTELGNLPLGKCKATVSVPISETHFGDILSSSKVGEAIREGFEVKWKVDSAGCRDCTNSRGVCGINGSLNQTNCFCQSQSLGSKICSSSPDATVEVPATPGSFFKRHKWIKIAIGIVAGIIVVSIIVICSLRRKYLSSKAMAFWKKETKDDKKVEEFMRNHESLAPKRHKYSEVKKITNSFADELGKGGFGVVYKGRLSDGRLVAVKILNQSKGNGEDFINEVASISRTSHVNIVNLLGFCHERTKRALIYEFMPNGSLDKFIYHHGPSNANCHLEWKTLYQIAVGIGRGLDYLHRGCNTRILHFDIKPHNILLDENFCPKISDFGLAKRCRNGESTVSMQNGRGTPGYVAPELTCRNLGKVSYKSDVYSYGMMVLEMVGGRKNIDVGVSRNSAIYFPQWIHNHLEQGQDLGLGGVVTEEEEEIARKMILVGLQCIQTIPSDRPSMTEVIEKLEGSLQSLEIPPRPVPSSSARPPRHSSTTSSS